jgi:serpin B
MGPAFDDERAEFGDMLDSSSMRAYISAVRHKTFINLNEAGTDAAAVTSVEMGATGMPAEPVKLSIDRPFFYAIVDTVTGSVLFTGTVREP